MEDEILSSSLPIMIETWSVQELENYIKKLEERKQFVMALIVKKKQHQQLADQFFSPFSGKNQSSKN